MLKKLDICVCANLLQSCPALCNPMDYSPPGSSVRGILQARILEWLAGPPSRNFPNPGIEPTSLTPPALAGRLFTASAAWESRWLKPFWGKRIKDTWTILRTLVIHP